MVNPTCEFALDTYYFTLFCTFSCSILAKLKQACINLGGEGRDYNATLSQHGPKDHWELLINKTNNPWSGKKQVHSSTFHINTIFRVFTYYGPFSDTGSQTKGLINLTQAELWLGLKRPWASQEQWKHEVIVCFVSAPISSLYLHYMLLK